MTNPYAPYQSPMDPQFTNPQPPQVFQPLAPKTKSKAGWVFAGIAIGIIALGLLVSPAFKHDSATAAAVAASTSVTAQSVPVPPPATVTVKETVTQTPEAPKDSSTLALMKTAYYSMTPTQQAAIRDGWSQYKGSAYESVFLASALETLRKSAPTLSQKDLVAFLDWTLEH